MLKLKNLVLYLFLLKLRILFNFTLGYINKYLRVTNIFLKKSLELGLGQRSYLIVMFVFMLVEGNLLIKKKSDK